MPDVTSERYRGYVLAVLPHDCGKWWFYEWHDPIARIMDVEMSYARTPVAVLDDAKRFIDRRIEGELADVERGLARMG